MLEIKLVCERCDSEIDGKLNTETAVVEVEFCAICASELIEETWADCKTAIAAKQPTATEGE